MLVDTAARIFVPAHRRRIGYVFQDSRLFPHLTVAQNLAYGRFFTPARERENGKVASATARPSASYTRQTSAGWRASS